MHKVMLHLQFQLLAIWLDSLEAQTYTERKIQTWIRGLSQPIVLLYGNSHFSEERTASLFKYPSASISRTALQVAMKAVKNALLADAASWYFTLL